MHILKWPLPRRLSAASLQRPQERRMCQSRKKVTQLGVVRVLGSCILPIRFLKPFFMYPACHPRQNPSSCMPAIDVAPADESHCPRVTQQRFMTRPRHSRRSLPWEPEVIRFAAQQSPCRCRYLLLLAAGLMRYGRESGVHRMLMSLSDLATKTSFIHIIAAPMNVHPVSVFASLSSGACGRGGSRWRNRSVQDGSVGCLGVGEVDGPKAGARPLSGSGRALCSLAHKRGMAESDDEPSDFQHHINHGMSDPIHPISFDFFLIDIKHGTTN